MSHLPWRVGAALVVVLLLLLVLGSSALAQPLTPIEQLGKNLFFDKNLSLNQNQSCASCHDPEAGWTGPKSSVNAAGSVYEGSIPGAFGDRKPPSSAYGSFSPILHVDKTGTFIGGMFWDGRATGERLGSPLAEQAQGPFLNPMEQALTSAPDVVSDRARLRVRRPVRGRLGSWHLDQHGGVRRDRLLDRRIRDVGRVRGVHLEVRRLEGR